MLTKTQEDKLIKAGYDGGLNDDQVIDLLRRENDAVQNKPQAGIGSRVMGGISKFSKIAQAATTAIGGRDTGVAADITDQVTQESFKRANDLTKQAKSEKDPAKKTALLSQAREIMSGAGITADKLDQQITNYMTAANIDDKDMEQSNAEFALRRGGAAALEAGSLMVPGGTGATSAGGRILQQTAKGATSGLLSGAATATDEAENAGEAATDIVTATVLSGLTSLLFATGGESVKKIKDARVKIDNKDIGKLIGENNGKQSWKNISNKYQTPDEIKKSFKDNRLNSPDIFKKVKNKWNNYVSNGEKILDENIDDIYKNKLEKTLKNSPRVKIGRNQIISALEDAKIGSDRPEVEQAAINWIKKNGKRVYSLNEAYDLKKMSMQDAFTATGKVKTALNPSSQRKMGWSVLGLIKSKIPKDDAGLVDEALSEMTTAYAWKDVVKSGFKKYEKLALKEGLNIDKAKVAVGAAKVAAGGSAAFFNPILGLIGAASQTPAIASSLKTPTVTKFGRGVVESQIPKGVPNVISSLIGKGGASVAQQN